MDNNESMVENKNIDELNLRMSAGNNKIKYYECDEGNCIFEILDEKNTNKSCDIEEKDINECCEEEEKNTVEKNKIYGQIIVKSILDCVKHEYLQGVKINLYRINGLSPILIESRMTNEEGTVIFPKVEEGCYRIIEIVDKRYFEKPKYIDWNEVTISDTNKKQKVIVINKIKRFLAKNRCI